MKQYRGFPPTSRQGAVTAQSARVPSAQAAARPEWKETSHG